MVWDQHFQRSIVNQSRIHDLRHFGATMLSHAGANPSQVQQFLGHSSPHDERRTILTDRLSKMAESVSQRQLFNLVVAVFNSRCLRYGT
jgi:integrase